jgi:monovalent cation:proton antiporter-2 (CPA2) family protein
MHLDSFLAQAFVYLLAAVVSVPIAKRLGLGSVLGYLLAGAAIGPFALGFIGREGEDVMHFAEFGVVMMLFLVGLELQPRLLWRLRGPILGMGGAQVLGTGVLIGGVGWAIGVPWNQALAAGLILSMSSTAIVLQSLAEKGQLKSQAGRSSFAVLLFQDIAVIPLLAFLPLLALGGASAIVDAHAHGAHPPLPAWQQALLTFGAVAVIVGGGRFLVRPVFRYIAGTKLREMFTAFALLLVVGIALLMQSVGLSPALGTFLAGVMLADSEFRHELESDIEPFKGLLLGIFFIAVGAGIDFALIGAEPLRIGAWVIGLIVLKALVLFVIARWAKLPGQDVSLFALAMAQGGEFCFVLLSFARGASVLPESLAKSLNAVVALSMALTPLLFLVHEKLLLPRLQRRDNEREADTIEDEGNPVIIAGFGRFGHVIGRLLKAHRIGTTVLDLDSEQVDFLRQLGLPLFYGDASRPDLLHAAGVHKAKVFILAIDDEEKSLSIVQTLQREFPHLTILARASGRIHAYKLIRAGADNIYRETLGSSLEMAAEALHRLGMTREDADRAAAVFCEQDERSMRYMAEVFEQHEFGAAYISAARQQIEEMEKIFAADAGHFGLPANPSAESKRKDAL